MAGWREYAVLSAWAGADGGQADAVRGALARDEARPRSLAGSWVQGSADALLAAGLGERLPPAAGVLADAFAAALTLTAPPTPHWHALALAQLRRGRLADAEDAARRGGTPADWLVLAQAARARGDASARGWWTRADGWVAEAERRLDGRAVPPGLTWCEWLHIKVLHRQTARRMRD
ncbi:MAG: hypothetical protein ACRC33_18215 [Gemmataceae bacterium]